jgi:hypothetical protein
MIDEFSVFGVAAACADGVTVVRDAAGLRYHRRRCSGVRGSPAGHGHGGCRAASPRTGNGRWSRNPGRILP